MSLYLSFLPLLSTVPCSTHPGSTRCKATCRAWPAAYQKLLIILHASWQHRPRQQARQSQARSMSGALGVGCLVSQWAWCALDAPVLKHDRSGAQDAQ